ncbi:MAG: type II toxin-antitoxin system RelE/ParE family toxin [Saprospiraceae bacterium]
MNEYQIIISSSARKQLDKLNNVIASPILERITLLRLNPRPKGYKKLSGRTGYRIRVGNYRILYDIVDDLLIIEVITIGHRKDVYG